MKIALDAMGGDLAPYSPVKGTLKFLENSSSITEVILVGDKNILNQELKGSIPKGIRIHHTTQVVSMHEHGSKAIKSKPDSSIVQGINLVKDGVADAFVSAGHTGAIMATSLLTLGRIEGLKRPALAAYIPTPKGGKILCDVGANPDARPEHMLQFAIMASTYFDHVEGKDKPKIGLVNIGTEPSKGSELYQETHKLLKKELSDDFIGNVEGRHLLDSQADILVCDGFVGNTILKFAESWVNLFIRQLNKQIMYKRYYQMTAKILEPVFSKLKKLYDYEEFGGVPLLGVNGVIIVSHGTSSPKAVKNSLIAAQKCVSENLLGDIQHGIKEHLVSLN
tara:strand:- start:1276 stop:2283 length:1008 start_codon:yes stop_codon:yes gene_type:complete